MKKAYFITGTDTNIGKTWATVALMHYFKQQGNTVAAMKPVASGCTLQNGHLRNEDAVLLQQHASIQVSYELINPFSYIEPASPHIVGIDNPVSISKIGQNFRVLRDMAEVILVEGAGGWYVPINKAQTISDLAKSLALPVIIVVGIRLGCINHARLTYEAIRASDLSCAGWLADCIDPDMLYIEENIKTIKDALPTPLLGILPYQEQADFAELAAQLFW